MAKTTTSIEYAAQLAGAANFNNRIDDHRKIGGAVQFVPIKVPITTDNEASDVITLIELPPGAIVFPELSKILVTDDMTSGALTIDIGDSEEADRYADGINCASTGFVEFCSVASASTPDGLHNRHKVEGDTRLITATLATFTATIEAGEFIVILAFKAL